MYMYTLCTLKHINAHKCTYINVRCAQIYINVYECVYQYLGRDVRERLGGQLQLPQTQLRRGAAPGRRQRARQPPALLLPLAGARIGAEAMTGRGSGSGRGCGLGLLFLALGCGYVGVGGVGSVGVAAVIAAAVEVHLTGGKKKKKKRKEEEKKKKKKRKKKKLVCLDMRQCRGKRVFPGGPKAHLREQLGCVVSDGESVVPEHVEVQREQAHGVDEDHGDGPALAQAEAVAVAGDAGRGG